jgi:hypothetical protein
MIEVRERTAAEREGWLEQAEGLLALVIWAAVIAALANLALLLAARRRDAREETPGQTGVPTPSGDEG